VICVAAVISVESKNCFSYPENNFLDRLITAAGRQDFQIQKITMNDIWVTVFSAAILGINGGAATKLARKFRSLPLICWGTVVSSTLLTRLCYDKWFDPNIATFSFIFNFSAVFIASKIRLNKFMKMIQSKVSDSAIDPGEPDVHVENCTSEVGEYGSELDGCEQVQIDSEQGESEEYSDEKLLHENGCDGDVLIKAIGERLQELQLLEDELVKNNKMTAKEVKNMSKIKKVKSLLLERRESLEEEKASLRKQDESE
jgi:hypothetical protein